MPIHSLNPATGDLLRSFPTLTEEALQARIAQAAAAAAIHRHVPLEMRALYLRKLAVLMEGESGELARTITLETGKPIRWSTVEVARCAAVCRYYAEHAARMLAPEPMQTGQGHSYVQWSPLGVVLAIMPPESPLWHPVRCAIAALTGGNVVLVKAAAGAPECALMLESLVRRAGFDQGVLRALHMEERMVERALNDERVAAVSVTGTEREGRAIAAQAGWLLKRSALHLSGSDAMVIMPSADLKEAAQAAARALTGVDGAGTGKRIIIASGAYHEFMHEVVAAVEALRTGDPLQEDTDVGPLCSEAALTTLTEQVDAAVSAGGRVVTGGAKMLGSKGHFFEPTLLSDVPRTAAVARDAIAGPAAMIFRARDLGDAIALANETPGGGAATVWTHEPAEQQALLSGVEAGTIALNAPPGFDPRLPVGGCRRSGHGRELGVAGLRELLQAQTVWIG